MIKTQANNLPKSPAFTNLQEKKMTENKAEIWREVPGFPKYLVSDLGNIKSIKGKESKKHINQFGYHNVNILDDKNSWRCVRVHRLVMLAFVGESAMDVDHLNEIKTDNRLCNLEYVSERENTVRYFEKKHKLNNRELPIGVTKKGNRFRAYIRINKKLKFLGSYDTPEIAHKVYKKATMVVECVTGSISEPTIQNKQS